MNSLAKIIVKVGKKSNVKLSHCKALRALVAKDLERLTSKYTDCNIVIIESITEEENDTVREFVKDFVSKNENNSVLFFIADENDTVTSGLADELDYNIYFTLKQVCEVIKSKYGLNVGATLEDRKITEDEDDNLSSLFEINEESTDNTTAEMNAMEDSIQSELEEADKVVEENIQEELQEGSHQEYTEKPLDLSELFDIPSENEGTQKDIESEPEIIGDISTEFNTETVEAPVIPTANNEEFEKYKEWAQEEIEKLQTKVKDANYDYNTLLKDIKGANSRVNQLEALVEVLKNEKQAIENRFNTLLESDNVIEDPISLSEYSSLKEQLNEKDTFIKKLEQTVEGTKEQIDELQSNIEAKDIEISSMSGTIEELNKKIQSGDVNQEEIEKLKEEIELLNKDVQRYRTSADKLRAEKDKISDQLKDIGELNEDAQTKADELSRKLSLEVDYRKETISLIQSAFINVKNTNSKIAKKEKDLNRLQQELSRSNISVDELRKQNDALNDDIIKLNEQIKEKDEAIEKRDIAMKSSDLFLEEKLKELDKVSKQKEFLEQSASGNSDILIALRTQVGVLEEQLKQKESQYDMLVNQSQNKDTTEVDNSILIITNKQLEQRNKSLLEQLSAVNNELQATKDSCANMKSVIDSYKDNRSVVGTATSEEGYTGKEDVSQIAYNASARIITVCSSGSFGATTLAMSIISRIAPTAKVLYMDFDMVTPNGDAWFSKSPFLSNIPNIQKNNKASSLGIFYEKGIDLLIKYVDNIKMNIENTKGGCIDYFSGVYYKVARHKIYEADYTTLFNTLGSMYEYIIVDVGRLGNSDVTDSLIREIAYIADKNIVVTTPDRFDVRQMNWKIQSTNLEKDKVVWLLNMCNSNQLDDFVQRVLKDYKFGQIFEDPALRGTREKFTRDRQNRDRLDAFINSALFYR